MDDEEYNAKKLPANDFFMGFYIPVKNQKDAHPPSYAKEMFYQLRRGDPSIIMGPMDRSITNTKLFLYNEKEIPTDAETIKTYVQGVHIINGKLKLSMRVKNNRSYQDLRAFMNVYNSTRNIIMNFDQIESASVFSAGLFQFAHLRYLNRDRMLGFMLDQHNDSDITSKINIFPRQFREKTSTGDSERSDVLWVTGAWEFKEEVKSFLFGIQWQSTYSGINIKPFRTNDQFTKDHQV